MRKAAAQPTQTGLALSYLCRYLTLAEPEDVPLAGAGAGRGGGGGDTGEAGRRPSIFCFLHVLPWPVAARVVVLYVLFLSPKLLFYAL